MFRVSKPSVGCALARVFPVLLAAFGAARAEITPDTLTFQEAAYQAAKPLSGQDTWKMSTVMTGDENAFMVADAAPEAGRLVSVQTGVVSTIYRYFNISDALTLELRWRWRARDAGAHFCVAMAGDRSDTRASVQAKACLAPQGVITFQGAEAAEKWTAGKWLYMRLRLDFPSKKGALYLATDSLRGDEMELSLGTLSAGTLSVLLGDEMKRVALLAEGGTGTVDVDDLAWEPYWLWDGSGSNLNWSDAQNWSRNSTPGSSALVVFNARSSSACNLDRGTTVNTLFFETYLGTLNLGVNNLIVTGNRADFTGLQKWTQSSGRLFFSGTKVQSVTGSAVKALPLAVKGTNGTLRLDGRKLWLEGLTQMAGTLDLNGQDLEAVQDISIRKAAGAPALANLGGRTLKAGKTLRMEGNSASDRIDLTAAAAWSAQAGDSLVAKHAVIAKSAALAAEGKAVAWQSDDSGGNTGWIFAGHPVISLQPQDAQVVVGQPATFKISAAPKLDIVYLWFKDSTLLLQTTDSQYVTPPATLAGDGTPYHCIVKNTQGQVTSSTALLKVTFPVPVLTPPLATFKDSLTVTFTAVDGAKIHYAVGSGAPIQAESATLRASATLRVFAVLGADTSASATGTYTQSALPPADPPAFAEGPSLFEDSLFFSFQAPPSGASIHFTTDGSTPSPALPPWSGKPVKLTATTTVAAIITRPEFSPSDVAKRTYTRFTAATQPQKLAAGAELTLSAGYRLKNGQGPEVEVKVLGADSLKSFAGFSIPMGFRVTSASVVPLNLTLERPSAQSDMLYRADADGPRLVSASGAVALEAQGLYFLGRDTAAPSIRLESEELDGDTTRAVFAITDNLAEVWLDLERSDRLDLGFTARAWKSGGKLTVRCKNPADALRALTVRLKAFDGAQAEVFPPAPAAAYELMQKLPGAASPALAIGADPEQPWALVGIPLRPDPALTLSQLRGSSGSPGLAGKVWNRQTGKYRDLAADEAIAPGSALWLGLGSRLESLVLPSLKTAAAGPGPVSVTLRKGYNQITNPTLGTLYWPISWQDENAIAFSPFRGLHGHRSAWFRSDSLVPWQGYFVHAENDVTLDLLHAPPPAGLEKRPSGLREGIVVDLALPGAAPVRLGALARAGDGAGPEDEPALAAPGRAASLWAARAGRRLGADRVRWDAGRILRWTICAGRNRHGNTHDTVASKVHGIEVSALRAAPGAEAWAVSRARGLRFRLLEGGILPLAPGAADTFEVHAGPGPAVRAALAAVPESVESFGLQVIRAGRGYALRLRARGALRLRWTLWSTDGRALAGKEIDLGEGVYRLDGIEAAGAGLRILELTWSDADAAAPRASGPVAGNGRGRLIRALAFP